MLLSPASNPISVACLIFPQGFNCPAQMTSSFLLQPRVKKIWRRIQFLRLFKKVGKYLRARNKALKQHNLAEGFCCRLSRAELSRRLLSPSL